MIDFKEKRISAGLSQQAVADKLEVSLRTYQRMEKDPKSLSVNDLQRIASIFDVSDDKPIIDNPEIIHIEDPSLLRIQRVALKASAGGGNHLESIDKFEVVETMTISRSLLKTQPNGTLRLIGVDGYSMVPMLYPDSLVLFDEHPEWRGDGLYILNWRNELMVKILQIDPHGKLHIKSANKDYESWIVDPDDQSVFSIVGKVLRIII